MNMTAQERPQRGRPRPAETIRRDETILQLLLDNPSGLLRNDIAQMMNMVGDEVKVYLSLDRLRKQGLADKVSSETSRADKDTLWVALKKT